MIMFLIFADGSFAIIFCYVAIAFLALSPASDQEGRSAEMHLGNTRCDHPWRSLESWARFRLN
jgi:hypothetical protein